MKLHSIQTSIGAATLADLSHHPQHPIDITPDWGLILWGRCDRVNFGAIVCNSKATWIADYSPNEKAAIVIYSGRSDVGIGDRVTFDSSCVDAICPSCGSSNYNLNGKAGYRCKSCGRQWKPDAKPRGGARAGAGRISCS